MSTLAPPFRPWSPDCLSSHSHPRGLPSLCQKLSSEIFKQGI